jgi:ABC-type transport system involved in multi-copper enzyme maturation permease subunit
MRPLLALFLRSLREDVRSRAMFFLRSGLVVLILFSLWQTHEEQQWSGAVGRSFFTSVLWIDLFILAVVGLSYFASAIAEEKDDDTLGLLRMTDLNSLAILLGKSTGRMCGALLLIAAQLPFMLLAVTMGGLDVKQVLAGFALLLSSTFFIANLALIGSVVCARTASATALTAAMLAAFIFIPVMFGFQIYVDGPSTGWLERCLGAWAGSTPIFRLEQITATGFHGSPLGWHFVTNLILGILCFLAAWRHFDRFEESDDEPDSRLSPAAPAYAGINRYGRPSAHPLSWKDFHFVAGGYRSVVIKSVPALLLLLLCFDQRTINGPNPLQVFGLALFSTGAFFLVPSLAFTASRIFKTERRDQTLSDLAILPCSIQRIVWEKVRGCLAADWPLLAMITLGAMLALPSVVRDMLRYPRGLAEGAAFCCCLTISAVQLPLSIAWMSLRVRWGGLPLGLTAWSIGNYLAVFLAFSVMRETSIFLLPFAGLIVAGMLIANIPRRLEQLVTSE